MKLKKRLKWIRESRLYRFIFAPLPSPRGLLARAVMIALAFAIAHALGLRQATSFISGTTPTGAPLTWVAVIDGGIYLLVYFAFVVLTPILLIAAGLLWVLEKIILRHR